MGFFIFQKYDTDVTFEKVMGQCHLSLTVAANDGEVLYRRKTMFLGCFVQMNQSEFLLQVKLTHCSPFT